MKSLCPRSKRSTDQEHLRRSTQTTEGRVGPTQPLGAITSRKPTPLTVAGPSAAKKAVHCLSLSPALKQRVSLSSWSFLSHGKGTQYQPRLTLRGRPRSAWLWKEPSPALQGGAQILTPNCPVLLAWD